MRIASVHDVVSRLAPPKAPFVFAKGDTAKTGDTLGTLSTSQLTPPMTATRTSLPVGSPRPPAMSTVDSGLGLRRGAHQIGHNRAEPWVRD